MFCNKKERETPYLSVFSPNAGKYGPEKLRMRTLFMQYKLTLYSIMLSSLSKN